MRVLLDTHVVIWWYEAPEKIRPEVLELIATGGHSVYVSAVTAWEMTIKERIGKLRMPKPLEAMCAEDWFNELPITFEHVRGVATLPAIHEDPFDRMLAAQAIAEDLTLVTSDSVLSRYPVKILAP